MHKKYIIILILSVLAAYISAMGYVAIHEEIHRIIYSSYGIRSTSMINLYMLQGSTSASNLDLKNITDNVRASQAMNEIIGYYTALIIFVLWMIVFIYLLGKIISGNPNSKKSIQ